MLFIFPTSIFTCTDSITFCDLKAISFLTKIMVPYTFVLVDMVIGVDVESGVGVHRHAHLSNVGVDLVGLVPAGNKGTVSRDGIDVEKCLAFKGQLSPDLTLSYIWNSGTAVAPMCRTKAI